MLVCLWKDCEFAFEEMAAFQEHVITRHVQQQQLQQQQQLMNLDNRQNGVANKEGGDHGNGGPMAKKSKMNEKEESKLINNGGQRKIIFLAIEVWVDVLGFVRRIQLARSVCFVNWKILEICWPRLHGNKAVAYHVPGIVIGCDESSHPPTAFLMKEHKKVPLPEVAPPDYITGFGRIQIKFLDHRVLAFLAHIAGRITTNKVEINVSMKMSHLDENQIASVNGLLQMFRETLTTIHSIHFNSGLSSMQFLPDVDNKMNGIQCIGMEESDIPNLMAFLTSPRADGKQRVMKMLFRPREMPMAQMLLDALKEEFRTSTQRLPQPFLLQFKSTLDITQSEEQNQLTDETLTITPDRYNRCLDISRHPRGQHEQWAEDARNRLIELPRDNSVTRISMNISEFGRL